MFYAYIVLLYLTEKNKRNKFRTMVERVVPRWNRYPEQPKRVVPFEAHNTFNPESAQWAHNLSAQPCAQSPRTTVPRCGAQARTNPSAQPQRTPFAHNPRAQPPTLVRTMIFFSVKYSSVTYHPQLRAWYRCRLKLRNLFLEHVSGECLTKICTFGCDQDLPGVFCPFCPAITRFRDKKRCWQPP